MLSWFEKSSCGSFPAHRAKPTAAAGDYHRALGPASIKDPTPDLGGDDETQEKVEEVQACLLRRLAECYLGVLAGKEKQRDEDQHGDAQHQVLHCEGPDLEDTHLHER
jgi:hypothetical protein